MAKKQLRVECREEDRAQLKRLLSGGVQPVRVVLRAQVLLALDRREAATRISRQIGLNRNAIAQIGKRYQQGGLARALYEKARPGAKPKVTLADRKRIVAMVCSDPPEGRARWTVRLVAEEAVKRRLVPQVGRETIRLLLLRDDLKPWREKNVVHWPVRPGIHREDGRCVGGV